MAISDARENQTVSAILEQLRQGFFIPGPMLQSNWFCVIKAPGHDLYLDYASRGTPGEQVVLGRKRTWQFVPIASGVFAILSDTGLAVDIAGGGIRGRNIIVWTRHDGENQQWTLRSDRQIQSPNSGLALDVADAVFAVGQRICAWSPHAGANQKWEIQLA
jgi:hypothetical protein